jgi:hypothetical protein
VTVLYYGRAAIYLASRFEKLSVHVNQVLRSGPFMQIIDVLGTEKKAAADPFLQLGQRGMGGIWQACLRFSSPLRIELPHQFRVRFPAFRRGNRLHSMAGPQPIAIAKCAQSAFCANAGSSQHKYSVACGNCNGIRWGVDWHLTSPDENQLPG